MEYYDEINSACYYSLYYVITCLISPKCIHMTTPGVLILNLLRSIPGLHIPAKRDPSSSSSDNSRQAFALSMYLYIKLSPHYLFCVLTYIPFSKSKRAAQGDSKSLLRCDGIVFTYFKAENVFKDNIICSFAEWTFIIIVLINCKLG